MTRTARAAAEKLQPPPRSKRFTACIQKMVARILIAFASGKFSRTASELCSPNQLII
jgi:hypothetical protein